MMLLIQMIIGLLTLGVSALAGRFASDAGKAISQGILENISRIPRALFMTA